MLTLSPQKLREFARRALRVLLSLIFWILGIWSSIAGVSVLFHENLSNFHAVPHFILGSLFLFLAIRRFIRRLGGIHSIELLKQTLVILVVIGLINLITVLSLGPMFSKPSGEFSDLVSEHHFNPFSWSFKASMEDIADFATFWSNPESLGQDEEIEMVLSFFSYIDEERSLKHKLDREGLSHEEEKRLLDTKEARKEIQRDVERILSRQVDETFEELGLDIPWYQKIVMFPKQSEFRFVPRLNLLVVSERDKLEIYSGSSTKLYLDSELTAQERSSIEDGVEAMGYSALVVGIGGVGTTPNIVIPHWLEATLRIISHERIHAWLETTPLSRAHTVESRVIEETSASLLGDAIGDLMYCKYYDASACEIKPDEADKAETKPDPNRVDFNKVLRETYLTVEAMLKDGRILEAEAYMDSQRDYLEENGSYIRKLNQAYFAFYGIYADSPAFEDGKGGIGRKLKELWDICDSPKAYFDLVREITSLEDIERVLSELK